MSPFDAAQSQDAARRRLADLLAAAGIETAALDARLLTMAALGVDHARLVRDGDAPLGPAAAALARLAERRLRREPVSRILGHREFYGLDFVVTPAVLDPRADTECLVEAALEAMADREAAWRILDLGVGSGAILAALLQACPNAWGVGIDRSATACRVARANLARLGLGGRGAILCASWAAALRGTVDVVVSNPPYIRDDEIAGLAPEVRLHDPPAALIAGENGLAAVRQVIAAAGICLRPGGWLGIEIGQGQASATAALLRAAGFQAPARARDLAGTERVVFARHPAAATLQNGHDMAV